MALSLKNKILTATIPLIVIFLSFFTTVLYFSGKKAIEKRTSIFIDEVIKSKAKEIGMRIAECRKDLEIIVESKELRDGELNSKENKDYIIRIGAVSKISHEMIFVSDINGDSYTSKGKMVNISDREYFQNIINKKSKFELSIPIISKSLGKPGYVIAIPIKDVNGNVKGVLGALVLIETISNTITEMKLSGKGEVGIINEKGDIIAHQIKEYVMNRNMFEILKKNIKDFDETKLKESGHIWHRNNNKELRYLSYSVIPNTNRWIIGISISESIMYEDIYKMLYALIFMSAGVIIIMSLTFYIMIKRATKPLKKLTDAVKEFSENMVETTITIDSRDEIQDLFEVFNKMSKIIIKHTNNLEETIREQTKELYYVNRKLLAQNSELEYLNEQLKEKNEDLYNMATRDNLTGFYNRYEMYRRMETMIAKKLRGKEYTFSVLIIDLDNFKYYNDTFGHDVGDEVLRLIADFLEKNLRENDMKIRYGGDEFIILVEENEENSIKIGEKIILELKNKKGFQEEINKKMEETFNIPEEKWILCSIGIYEYEFDIKKTPEEIIKIADEALYKAKKMGKGRVEVKKQR